ncbi:MAG: hypothetical protein KDC48_03410 [Planctomycetes bacterium]|nr:hypothetical protein [Planctomycetota bacterium]
MQSTNEPTRWLLTLLATGAPLLAQAANYDELVAQAENLRREQKLDAAFALASKACQSDPKRYEGFLLVSLVLYERGAEAEAGGYLARAHELAPPEQRAGMEQLRNLLDEGADRRKAATHLQTGRDARAAGLHAKAAAELLAAHRLQPFDVAIAREAVAELSVREQWFELAQVLRRLEQTPRLQDRAAITELAETAAPLLQREYDQVMTAAEAAVKALDWEQAAAGLTRAVVFDPRQARPHYLRGLCLTRLGDLDGAVAALADAIANGHYAQADYADAFELNRLRNLPAFQKLLADAFGQDAAKSAREHFVTAEVEVTRLQEDARLYATGKDFARAFARLRDGLQMLPGDPSLTFEQARMAALAGNREAVPALLDRCLELGFADQDRWFGTPALHPFLVQADRLESAYRAWGPGDKGFGGRSDAHYLRGDNDGALTVLRYDERWNPQSATCAMRQARILTKTGNRSAALERLEAAGKRGFADLDFVINSPEFSPLRDAGAYKQALLQIARNKEK